MEPHPWFPSAIDPFDILGCSTLPFPLTREEDIALKYILRTATSDDQMYDRAYEAIVCMWARKAAITAGEPFLMSISPNTVNTIDYNYITLTGTDFKPGCKVYKNGFDNGNVTYNSSTELIARVRFDEPSGITLAVVNPGSIMGNNLTLVVNPHPDTPRITAIQPLSMSKEIVGAQTLHVYGTNFLTGCVILKSSNIPGLWDGMELATTFVSSTHVTALVDLANTPAGQVVIRVMNKTAIDWYQSYPAYITITLV